MVEDAVAGGGSIRFNFSATNRPRMSSTARSGAAAGAKVSRNIALIPAAEMRPSHNPSTKTAVWSKKRTLSRAAWQVTLSLATATGVEDYRADQVQPQ